MSFQYPPRLGWCTKHASPTVCKDCEIERLTAELAEVMEEAKVWQDRYRKRGYVMDEHAKALERAEVAEAELDRYKQGVEVEGYISDDGLGIESISMWDYRKRFKKGQRVRVLVMKEEVEG